MRRKHTRQIWLLLQGPQSQYLSVIMLGFIVTRSVLLPTSVEYFSFMGGILHLQKKEKCEHTKFYSFCSKLLHLFSTNAFFVYASNNY